MFPLNDLIPHQKVLVVGAKAQCCKHVCGRYVLAPSRGVLWPLAEAAEGPLGRVDRHSSDALRGLEAFEECGSLGDGSGCGGALEELRGVDLDRRQWQVLLGPAGAPPHVLVEVAQPEGLTLQRVWQFRLAPERPPCRQSLADREPQGRAAIRLSRFASGSPTPATTFARVGVVLAAGEARAVRCEQLR